MKRTIFSYALTGMVLWLFGEVALWCIGVYVAVTVFVTVFRFPLLRHQLQRVEEKGRGGFIYGFADYGQLIPTIKIGRESQQGQRLAIHRTAAPFGLFVYYSFPVRDAHFAERILHRRYSRYRVRRNNEWFYLVTLQMFIETLLLRIFGA